MRRILPMLFLLWPLAGWSQSDSPYVGSAPLRMGEALLKWCETEDEADMFLCMGYLAGVSDALEAISFTAGWGTSGVCRPRGTTLGKVRDEVIAWAKDNPRMQGRAGSVMVISALQDAFPCERDDASGRE